jgi:hypothetical protein
MKQMYCKVWFSLLIVLMPICCAASVSKLPSGSNRQSVGVTEYKKNNESSGLFGNENGYGKLRSFGDDDGDDFGIGGGIDAGNGFNDVGEAPLGSFPCVFFLCLAVGYGVYRTISHNIHCETE